MYSTVFSCTSKKKKVSSMWKTHVFLPFLPLFLLPPLLLLSFFLNAVGSFTQAEKVTTPAIRHISAEVVPMGPPPPPKPKQTKDSTFMEKLHAVDEELASSPVCMDSFQVNIIALNP
jgi:hypothetical protein